MAGGRDPGGIFGLLDLIEEHRAALRYDWRARFHAGLDDSVPDRIGWDEALDLVRIIRLDPSSQLAASIEGWVFPLAREGWMLADLIDIQGSSKYKKWTPYSRPIRPKSSRRLGDLVDPTTGRERTRAEVIQILNRPGRALPS